MVSITVYDGANTIGGNKIYVEERGRGLFLDFGMNFAKYGEFFEEYLSERDGRGIHDLLFLNLIPRLNIYRRDLITRDVDVSRYPRLNVEAVLLSHAHLDHCGNIGLLDERIPVMASPTTIAILKALRDASPSRIGSEIAYLSRKVPMDETGLVLESEERREPYRGRDFYCAFPPSKEMCALMSQKPGQESKSAKKLEPGKLCRSEELDLPFEVEAYAVDHSIYGAVGYVLRGDTTVAYTGDFRLHGKKQEKTRAFVKAAKGASTLVIEGTTVGREGAEGAPSVGEDEVLQKCLAATEETDKLVVADFSARNFERLETFAEIARETGRQLVVVAKDAYTLHAMECADGVRRMGKDMLIYYELKNRRYLKWETEVVMGRWGGQYVRHEEISRNPGGYVLCFSFFDMKHLLDIKPDGGTYIYSSSEAFSEEQVIDFQRLGKWLRVFGFRTYGFRLVEREGELRPEFERGYHTSGHASRGDLEWVIGEIEPDRIIPVHTTGQGWFKERFENAVTPEEGKKFSV